MTEENTAPEAVDEVVTSPTETAEEPKITEGQEKDQPAEDTEGAEPEVESEDVSKAKARRERRKADRLRLKQELREATDNARKTEDRLKRIKDASQSAQPPKADQFEDYNDYLIAMAAHQSVAALDKRQASEVEEEAAGHKARVEAIEKQRQQEMREAWLDQAADARGRYADFDKVVTDGNLPITEEMVQVIVGSDLGADLAYHLGTHREEAARIAQMEPLEMARTLGALEARLSLPKPKTNSDAPDPISPVKPKASARNKDPEKMTFEEYNKWREAGGTF